MRSNNKKTMLDIQYLKDNNIFMDCIEVASSDDSLKECIINNVLSYLNDNNVFMAEVEQPDIIEYILSADPVELMDNIDIHYMGLYDESVDGYVSYKINIKRVLDGIIDYYLNDIPLQLLKSKVIYNDNNDYGIVNIDDESYVIERGFTTAKVIFNDIDLECIAEYLSEVTYKDLQQYFGYYGLWNIYNIEGSYYLTTTDYYIEPLKDIHFIEVTKWQDVNGNTYHTAMIYYDDLSKEYIPYTYGYGRQWQQTIKERLKRDIDYSKINYKDRIVKRKSDMI